MNDDYFLQTTPTTRTATAKDENEYENENTDENEYALFCARTNQVKQMIRLATILTKAGHILSVSALAPIGSSRRGCEIPLMRGMRTHWATTANRKTYKHKASLALSPAACT